MSHEPSGKLAEWARFARSEQSAPLAANPKMNSLVVSEVFGQTVQGEGPSAGRRASFIRLGGCNLACGWCDTA